MWVMDCVYLQFAKTYVLLPVASCCQLITDSTSFTYEL